jgi:hypothetical protein
MMLPRKHPTDRSESAGFAVRLLAALVVMLAIGPGVTNAAEALAERYLVAKAPQVHIIAFANSRYVELDELKSVARDYHVIRESFRGPNIVLHGDADNGAFISRTAFWDKLRVYLSKVDEGDIVFFYYSGHGYSFNGANYLLPLDYPKTPVSTLALFQQAVPLHDVIAAFERHSPAAAILMLDSCRTGINFKLKRGDAIEDTESQPAGPENPVPVQGAVSKPHRRRGHRALFGPTREFLHSGVPGHRP